MWMLCHVCMICVIYLYIIEPHISVIWQGVKRNRSLKYIIFIHKNMEFTLNKLYREFISTHIYTVHDVDRQILHITYTLL